jgi:hypothetical protein
MRPFLALAASLVFAGTASAYPPPSPSPPVPKAVVTLESVSNGCGGGVASNEYKYADDSDFVNSNVPFAGEKRYHVNFREACKLHDAGYSGAELYDPLNGGYYDFFRWTRAEIDQKFLADMRKICDSEIPATATIALHDCKWQGGYHLVSGAYTRYLIVHNAGDLFFNKRPNLRGLWGNPADPTGPPWAIVQTGRLVKASWRGGKGHTGLRGTFEGTLISHDQDYVVDGMMHVTEGTLSVLGTMTFTISNKNLDKFQLEYQQANGVTSSAEMVRQ